MLRGQPPPPPDTLSRRSRGRAQGRPGRSRPSSVRGCQMTPRDPPRERGRTVSVCGRRAGPVNRSKDIFLYILRSTGDPRVPLQWGALHASQQSPSPLNIIGLAVCVVGDVVIIAVPSQHIRREQPKRECQPNPRRHQQLHVPVSAVAQPMSARPPSRSGTLRAMDIGSCLVIPVCLWEGMTALVERVTPPVVVQHPREHQRHQHHSKQSHGSPPRATSMPRREIQNGADLPAPLARVADWH